MSLARLGPARRVHLQESRTVNLIEHSLGDKFAEFHLTADSVDLGSSPWGTCRVGIW